MLMENETQIPIKPDLTNKIIELLLFKMVLNDSSYANLLMKKFDKRWLETDEMKYALNITLSHYKKYNNTPNRALLSAYLDKIAENVDFVKSHKNNILDCYDSAIELNIGSIGDEIFVRNQILSYIRDRGLYFAIMDNVDDIESRKDPGECIKAFEEIMNLSLDDDIGSDYLENISSHMDDLCSETNKCPTGIPSFDKTMGGGIDANGDCLVVFVAQPCLGKSLMLSNIAKNKLDQNSFVVIITLELSEKMYQRRFDAHITKRNIDELHRNRKYVEDELFDYAKKHPGAKLIVKRMPEGMTNTYMIQTYIDQLIKRGKRVPDVIFVDYMNLMIPNFTTYRSTMYERVGAIGRELRAMSFKYKTPVVSVTQVNTEGYNTSSVGLENISESKGTAHTGDVIIALTQEEDDVDAGIINAKFLKNRYGKNHKKCRLKIDYETLIINDYEVRCTDDVNNVIDNMDKDDDDSIF